MRVSHSFYNKNSVLQAQAGVFLLFCQFEAEIFLSVLLDYRYEYALLFQEDKFYCALQIFNMSQPQAHSKYILKISEILSLNVRINIYNII